MYLAFNGQVYSKQKLRIILDINYFSLPVILALKDLRGISSAIA
jgi:hypothetical protein